jgi:hypothetical protein
MEGQRVCAGRQECGPGRNMELDVGCDDVLVYRSSRDDIQRCLTSNLWTQSSLDYNISHSVAAVRETAPVRILI